MVDHIQDMKSHESLNMSEISLNAIRELFAAAVGGKSETKWKPMELRFHEQSSLTEHALQMYRPILLNIFLHSINRLAHFNKTTVDRYLEPYITR